MAIIMADATKSASMTKASAVLESLVPLEVEMVGLMVTVAWEGEREGVNTRIDGEEHRRVRT